MSMYHAIFGIHPLATEFLAVLKNAYGLEYRKIPRFRDCYLNKDGTEIIIHTRTGGGNRAGYEEGNKYLQSLPGYVSDADDSFDSTYAYFHFAVPDGLKRLCKAALQHGGHIDPNARWKELLSQLQHPDKDPT